MILSASGSSSMPIVVICPRLRARYPSSPSVVDASTKRIDARISCVPLGPVQGKCGDKIHKNNGIMMIRVIVMELGRFMFAGRDLVSGSLTPLLHQRQFRLVSGKETAGKAQGSSRHECWAGAGCYA